MSKFSRDKGRRGELEIARIVNELTGWDVKRRVRQHDGDSDIEGIPGWSVEVKNCATLAIPEWWRQAVRQSVGSGFPVLFYKVPRKGWRAMWPLAPVISTAKIDASPGAGEWLDERFACHSTVEAWACVAREVYAPF